MQRILLCTDLDRTLLPNGSLPESAMARRLFNTLASTPEITLAYVSGRHLALVQEAIAEYSLPQPDFILGDVGSTVYFRNADNWHPDKVWEEMIGRDFTGYTHTDIVRLLADYTALRLQEAAKQNPHKISYYVCMPCAHEQLTQEINQRLEERGIRASVIFSLDEITGDGLVDILPKSATKLGAVRYLMDREGFSFSNTVFAGDSGNDLAVMTSRIKSIVVANASDELKNQALAQASNNGTVDSLYIATGGFAHMNGNYSAGIIEGLVHYIPETKVIFTP